MKRVLFGTVGVAVLLALPFAHVNAQDAEEAEPSDAAAEAEEPPDPYEVPEGTPEELMKYMDELGRYRPRVTNYGEYLTARKKKAEAMAEATGRILAAEVKLEDVDAEKVIQSHIAALSSLAGMGDEKAVEKLTALPERLKKLGHESLIRLVEAKVLEAKFNALRKADDPAKAIVPLLDEVEAFIKQAGKGVTKDDARLAYSVTRAADGVARIAGDPQIAIGAYKAMGRLLLDSGSEDTAGMGKKFVGAARRMDLPGKPIEIEGFKLDGEPFNIDSLKGKTVLVDFWATWCGPCLAEIPNMTAMYDAYNEKGFEIVGVSVDTDIDRLKKLIEDRNTPWIILQDRQAEKPDYEENSNRYGIFGIPTMILVGADGKVISTTVRGHALNAALEEIYGPVEEEPVEEKLAEEEPVEEKPVEEESVEKKTG